MSEAIGFVKAGEGGLRLVHAMASAPASDSTATGGAPATHLLDTVRAVHIRSARARPAADILSGSAVS